MTMLFLTPHPLGLVVRTQLPPGEAAAIGNHSELLIEGESFGGVTFERLRTLAGVNGGKIDAIELRV